jgi:hypothetical protein
MAGRLADQLSRCPARRSGDRSSVGWRAQVRRLPGTDGALCTAMLVLFVRGERLARPGGRRACGVRAGAVVAGVVGEITQGRGGAGSKRGAEKTHWESRSIRCAVTPFSSTGRMGARLQSEQSVWRRRKGSSPQRHALVSHLPPDGVVPMLSTAGFSGGEQYWARPSVRSVRAQLLPGQLRAHAPRILIERTRA